MVGSYHGCMSRRRKPNHKSRSRQRDPGSVRDVRAHEARIAADGDGVKVGDRIVVIDFFKHPQHGDVHFVQPFTARLAFQASVEAEKSAERHRPRVFSTVSRDKKGQWAQMNEGLVFKLLRYETDAIVNAAVAIESYLNLAIPDGAKLDYVDREGNEKTANRKDVMSWSIRDKAACAVPQLRNVESLRNRDVWDAFDELVTLRNKLVHARPQSGALWARLIAADYEPPSRTALTVISHFDETFIPPELRRKKYPR